MHFCLLGKLHIVVSNALLQNASHLFENLLKIVLKLRSQTVEKFFHILTNLFTINSGQIILNLSTNIVNKFL